MDKEEFLYWIAIILSITMGVLLFTLSVAIPVLIGSKIEATKEIQLKAMELNYNYIEEDK